MRDELSGRTPASIEWMGWVDEEGKRAFFSALDCLVVPSEWKDPAPLVVNEARALGVPVIGARIGGIPELIAPEWEPLLYPAGDGAALQARLATFAADPGAFAAREGPRPGGWDEHLDRVLGAYDDAGSSREAPNRT